MSIEESISLEETNKIHISLGLKPLTDDSASVDDREKQAEENYDRLSRVRNRQELNAKLKGSALGNADGDVDDTLKGIKKSKKRDKELARKRQEELEDMGKAFQEDCTEKNLAGLRVSHDFEGMDEGKAHISTLKDSRILDNEEDELQSLEMAEHECMKKKKKLKIKRWDYTGYSNEKFTPGAAGMKQSLLFKYDDFLEGLKETICGFQLGTNITSAQSRRDEREQAAATVNKFLLSMNYAKNIESEDCLKEGDIGFQKPKTKKKKASRRMQVDKKPILQAAVARSCTKKLQKAKKLSSEDIARRGPDAEVSPSIVAEERTRSEVLNEDGVITIGEDGDVDGESGLTFDDTSEFVRAITYEPTLVKKEPPAATPAPVPMEITKPRSPSVDVKMELEAGEVRVKEEEDDEEMLNVIENAIKNTEAAEKAAAEGMEVPVGMLTEQMYSADLASTLNILHQQGILAAPTSDQKERDRNLESFKNYKADVNIVYYDEFGHELTQKEAWKALSHNTGSPAPRPGFPRISAAAEPFASSKEGTPVPSDRTKLVIGLSVKHKVVGEAASSPPPKKW
ncbi:uncharacterized protein LAESUDRAFT_770896 [Laetiporus sulphureus 93-53]|uniref:SART-1 protein n=1 Tax=Laetiporus sulphureus 93-53 TaxID=1314785 RepID=A0A165EV42_9APHY|nr:uncharacterized protein LAESUDRAFT_770896 [Laetiporus sulphureus 93-53]KZT07823.1 hypothetical protein LAESUDRAFT_770896 [Laetiporus sulphureus 93-53]